MPATPPTRSALHTRRIQCDAWERSDGLIDIEAGLQDLSPQGTDLLFRTVPAGGIIHDMHVTLTIDLDMVIRAINVSLRMGPIASCSEIESAYDALKGLQIRAGFHQQVRQRVGGVRGCTHLTELLNPLATTAMQARMAIRRRARNPDALASSHAPMPRPGVIGTCHTYREDSAASARLWPPHRRQP